MTTIWKNRIIGPIVELFQNIDDYFFGTLKFTMMLPRASFGGLTLRSLVAPLILVVVVSYCPGVIITTTALSFASEQTSAVSRRTFLWKHVPITSMAGYTAAIIAAVGDSSSSTTGDTMDEGTLPQGHPTFSTKGWSRQTIPRITTPPAFAYERREVGGVNRSPETAAMNEQAYQTQNRLERDGFKLDSEEDQKALVGSLLSDYSYSASIGPSPVKGDRYSKGQGASATKSKNEELARATVPVR